MLLSTFLTPYMTHVTTSTLWWWPGALQHINFTLLKLVVYHRSLGTRRCWTKGSVSFDLSITKGSVLVVLYIIWHWLSLWAKYNVNGPVLTKGSICNIGWGYSGLCDCRSETVVPKLKCLSLWRVNDVQELGRCCQCQLSSLRFFWSKKEK